MALPDNRILGGKYRLLRQLDEGGMGAVWLAEHLSLHSPVAVKLISSEVAETEEGVQRFLREARAAASLRSPHVVQILDYGVDQATPYIVMELLDGESLAARLERVKRLSPVEMELVLRHVARAVARAHDAGIVHRDLKPANIFIIENEDEELVKLVDFGIAKAGLDALGASIASNTRTGAFLGTPFYVSPEQAEGIKSLDHRTDIWSMGVIAFECLIGRQPFVGDTFGSLVLSICSRPMPVPSRQGPVPAGFDAWFAHACAREVDQRFQSAREAAAALRQLIEPGTADVSPPTQHSEGVPQPGPESSLPPLEAPAPGEALSSWPAPRLGITTGVVSSSATTRRRPGRLSPRVWVVSGLGGLALIVILIRVSVSGAPRQETDALELSAAPISVAHPTASPSEHTAAAATSTLLQPVPSAPAVSVAPLPREKANPPSSGPIIAPVREAPPLPVALPARRPERPPIAKAIRAHTAPSVVSGGKPAPLRPNAAPATLAPKKVQPVTPVATPPAPPKHGVNLGI